MAILVHTISREGESREEIKKRDTSRQLSLAINHEKHSQIFDTNIVKLVEIAKEKLYLQRILFFHAIVVGGWVRMLTHPPLLLVVVRWEALQVPIPQGLRYPQIDSSSHHPRTFLAGLLLTA